LVSLNNINIYSTKIIVIELGNNKKKELNGDGLIV